MNTLTKFLPAILIPACFITKSLQAQTNVFPSTGSAGIGTTSPHASSALEIVSTTKGLLISRMTKAQRDAITTPATGLMIYQTNSTPGFYYYDGSAWTAVTPKSKAWSLNGNGGTDPLNNFIGTTDGRPLVFKVNNQKAGLLDYDVNYANSAFGYQSLYANTGINNCAFGYWSLFNNTSGTGNTAVGSTALYSNSIGNHNVATGFSSLSSNTTGSANVANGAYALSSNTSGDYNVANGFKALYSNTGGYANTATGYLSLQNNTAGILNTATGSESLFSNTTGNYNTAHGYMTLYYNTTGNDNTAMGLNALHYNTTGSYNTATGRDALLNNTTGSYNTANGNSALYSNTTGYYNTATGWNALRSNTTAIQNTANGFDALASNTTGEGNMASGYAAMITNTTGAYNTSNGAFSMYNNSTGNYNTATGYLSLTTNSSGASNTANGYQSLRYNTTGNTNVANGTYALYSNTTGSTNVASGSNSLYSNTTGFGNTATGYQSLYYNTTGNFNTAHGHFAGFNDNAAYYNTEIGSFAGYGVVNGDANTNVGYFAGPTTAGLTNSGAFGYLATQTASNQIRIGNSSVTSIGGQVGWSTFSDGRFKKNIHENVPGLEFIKKLKPITYTLDVAGLNKKTGSDKKISESDKGNHAAETAALAQQEKIIYTGFVAQDVEKAAKSLNYDFSGVDAPKNEDDLYGLRYDEFVAPLVKAVQELSEKNDDLQEQIDELKAILNSGKQTNSGSTSNVKLQTSNLSPATLEQNKPNPFSNSTMISYTLPQQFSSAQIMVTDKSGKTIKQIQLTGKGNGSLQIDASGLSSGTYQYSLIVDGKNIETKQMVHIR